MVRLLLALGSNDGRLPVDAVPIPENELEKPLVDGADKLMQAAPAIYEFWQECIN